MKNKIIDIKKRLSENGKRAVAYLLVGSLILGLVPMTVAADTAESTETTITSLGETLGDMNIVPYNNEDLRVDVASGGWATPVVTDYDGDGVLDIILGSNSTPYPGVMLFLGTDNAQKVEIDGEQNADYLLMNNAQKLSGKMQPLGSSIYQHYKTTEDNQTVWKYGEYDRTLITGWGTTYGTSYPGVSSDYGYALPVWEKNPDIYVAALDAVNKTVDTIDGVPWKQMIKGNNHLYADYDGDGDLDLIYSVDHYGEYGWIYGQDAKYKPNGQWGDGDDPIRSWVFWFENVEGDTYATKGGTTFDLTKPQLVTLTKDDGTVAPVDTYAGSTPQFCDWDFDGDLDIICGDWFGNFTYFENDGTRENSKYKEGRSLLTEDEKILRWTGQAGLSLTSADWNQDGYMDIIASGEDGRVVLIEHAGKKSKTDGTPIFKDVQHFQMPAEGVKLGMETSPCSFDWDQDGDEDIISGNALGYIIFTENLTIDMVDGVDKGFGDRENPTWAKPVPLRNSDDKSIYRITAGDSLVDGVVGGGSPQGPDEDAWGYTTVTVGDWNGDKVPDIISNNIWGRVYFHEGIQGDTDHVKRAVPIEVEWENENKHPEWNWWDPEGNELVTVWRTTPFMIDLPLEDRDGDGDADADDGDGLMDLVMLDHEGYLAYYQRYRSSDGTLKLKEGKRIFKDNLGNTYRLRTGDYGENGRVKILLVDYNQDGMLDIIYTDDVHERNVIYAQNLSTTPGEYVFSVGDTLHERSIYNHSVSPTVCDWDGNRIPDLLMGAEDGHMYYLKNNVAGKTDNAPDNEEEPTPTLDDYLVAHWDFEDDGTGNALKDKATAGITADDLTVYDSDGVAQETTDIAIADGVATIKNDASLRTAVETAGVSTDLDITGELTLFMKVKVDAINLWSVLASKGLANSAYWLGLGNQDGYGLYFSPRKAFSKIVLPKHEWREVAAVVNYNSNSEMVVTIYVSNDSSTKSDADYQYYSEIHTDKNALGSNDAAFIIGNALQFNAGDPTTLTRDFDDVRIYNKALTATELATLLPDTTVQDSLVAHWDFEDNGTGNALNDKATAGATPDNLTIYDATCTAQSTVDVTIEKGVATINGGAYLRAEHSADLNITGELTMYMKVQVTGNEGGIYYLANKGNLNAYAIMNYPDYGSWGFRHQGFKWSTKPLTKGTWTTLAVVVSYNDAGKMILDYYAAPEGADALVHLKTNDPEDRYALQFNSLPFYIGNTTNENGADKTTIIDEIRKYDDVRIYNKALTAEQLAGVYDEEEEMEEVDASLVAHWDFVGNDEDTQLSDKGSGENPLTMSENVSIADGVATVTGDGYLRAAAAGLNVNEEMTVFARVKVDKTSVSAWGSLLSKLYADNDLLGNAKGYSIQLYPNDGNGVLYYGASVRGHNTNFAYDCMAANEWREIAFVVSKDADGMYTQKFMISKNEATADADDFVTYFTRRTPIAEHVAESTDLTIGNAGTPENSTVTRMFDDVRIYDRALSSDELAAFEFTEGTDTTSYYLESLDNTIGFGYYEHIARYNVETENDSVTLTPVAEDAAAVIKVNNEVVTSGTAKTISLVEGANTVTVTLGVGTTVYRTYTLSITRNPVMTEKLASLIQKVGKYENTGYEAWDLFATALADAEALLASENLNDDEAGKCYKALLEAETQLFAQKNLPPVSLKGFKHVTLEDFGLESRSYISDFATQLSSENSLDQVLISMHVDFQQVGASGRIDFGGNGKGLYIYPGSDRLYIFTMNANVIPDVWHNIPLSTLKQAGLTSTLDKFFMQISFEYKDYDNNGTDDGMQVNMYVNGMNVYSRDLTGCELSQLNSQIILRVNTDNSVSLDSVIGDAHADGALDPRDLVAVVKKADGTDLGNTYENTVADVNRQAPVDQEDVTGLRSKLLD